MNKANYYESRQNEGTSQSSIISDILLLKSENLQAMPSQAGIFTGVSWKRAEIM
jgi:hypothetical protein